MAGQALYDLFTPRHHASPFPTCEPLAPSTQVLSSKGSYISERVYQDHQHWGHGDVHKTSQGTKFQLQCENDKVRTQSKEVASRHNPKLTRISKNSRPIPERLLRVPPRLCRYLLYPRLGPWRQRSSVGLARRPIFIESSMRARTSIEVLDGTHK